MDNKKTMVWCDVDDVIVDTSELMEATLRRMTGKSIPWRTWPNHNFGEVYGFGDEGIAQLRDLWIEDKLLERAPLRPGVNEALSGLASQGYHVGLITARGWHPRGLELTWDMADRFELPVSEVVVLGYLDCKAEKLMQIGARVDGFVDDTPRHVRACLGQGWRACVMEQPWNASHSDLPRVGSLTDFAGLVSAAPARTPRSSMG